MCTVTLYRDSDALVLTTNRDELRERGERGVRHCIQGGSETIYPVDAEAQGTWIGVNSHGLVLCLLNNYQAAYDQSQISRGLIITSAISAKNMSECQNWIEKELRKELYNPFFLIVSDKRDTVRFSWDGHFLGTDQIKFDSWWIDSSSSENFEETIKYRQAAFTEWQSKNGRVNTIMDFHLQQDNDEMSRSICMSRSLTHTKSITQIRIEKGEATLNYISPEQLPGLINSESKAEHQGQNFNIKLIEQ